ncbi:XRE family transcriptional regulator [Bacteroides sp. AN502(2024)]|uniref:XRE family transcriptional regulator n=1 Tax=Bacteroides sp. AN502(2024) TaxID=3160599 RepID=UPI0035139E83
MSINERFGKIIRTLYGGNKSAFASAIGVAPSVVENIVGKRQGKPSFDVVEKVCAIAEVNTTWFITGRGDAFDFRPEEEKVVGASPSTGIEDKLFAIIQEKDATIRTMSEEIGQLRERIAQMQQRFEKNATNANTDTIANVG